MARLRMAVVGVGHLGQSHARILSGLPDVELVGVVDVNLDQAQAVARRHGTQAYPHYWPLLNLIDAACIVVPTSAHHPVALDFLRRGIHLLVEKPLAPTLEQAESLVDEARAHGAVLQVGHVERFNPAFEELARRPLQPKFIESERLGPFTGRSMDIGVVLDLMIHDLDLILALARSPMRSVEAVGVRVFGEHEDVANARIVLANGCVANVTASRVSGTPRRCMRVWAPEGYAGIDFARRRITFVQPSAQLRRQALKGRPLDAAAMALVKDQLFGHHLQMLSLERAEGDQLTRELQDFVHCAQSGVRPRVSGEDGRDALALASRVLDSLRAHVWEGVPGGPAGPAQLPAPLGHLFESENDEAAA
jgi:predicted dehydrogenase